MYASAITINETECSAIRSLLDYLPKDRTKALGGIDYAQFRRTVASAKKRGDIVVRPVQQYATQTKPLKFPDGKCDKLARKIAALRSKMNIGVPTLATVLGVSHNLLYNCESNKAKLEHQQEVYDKLKGIDIRREISMHYSKRQRHLKKGLYATGK